MKLDKSSRILIVGLGVMGGSYAEALTKRGYTVRCITKNQEDIDYAIKAGIISYGTTETDEELIKSSDIIIFALYPTVFIEWIEKYQKYFSTGTFITDLSGVKGGVVGKVQAILRPDVEFVSTHPMAGRESSGVKFANSEVFKGANYIITPMENNSPEAINLARELGYELGFARISTLSVTEHDKMIAFLSQLTHCIAVSLMNSNVSDGLEKYTGDSFRDLTRIAKINDKMWAELFILNKELLLAEMDAFIEEFNTFRNMLSNSDSDGMREKMRRSTKRRTLFDKPKS